MSTANREPPQDGEHHSRMSACANCGKEDSSDNMNTCNKCKLTKYCNAACKKKHRHKHKQECESIVAEQHDRELFKQPPPLDDCPICFLRLPTLRTGCKYFSCCGKQTCGGCEYAISTIDCPFCRTPCHTSDEEDNERCMKRIEIGDAEAMYNLGKIYRNGKYGLPQDNTKALELWHRAAELGHASSQLSIGYAYETGRGVEVDKKKALYYYELSAMGGNTVARCNLGMYEKREGNVERALKHHMIAAGSGRAKSLTKIKELYKYGHATKDDYTKALRCHQEYLGEIKSPQRDKAAAARENYRYYE